MTATTTPTGPVQPPKGPLRRVVASHQAHYWFTAKQLLASMVPDAPEIRGSRRKAEFGSRLHAVLLPIHPDAKAASRTSVGMIGFTDSVEVLALMLEVDPIPLTPFSANLAAAAPGKLAEDGVDAADLQRKLHDKACAELAAHRYV